MVKLETVKIMLNAITTASSEPLSIGQLQSEYKSMEGEFIPFNQLGFSSLELFLRSIPDTIRLAPVRGQLMVVPIVSAANSHIRDMVQKQKNDTKKVSYRIDPFIEQRIVDTIAPQQKLALSQLPTSFLSKFRSKLPAPKGKLVPWLSTSNRFAVTTVGNTKFLEIIGGTSKHPIISYPYTTQTRTTARPVTSNKMPMPQLPKRRVEQRPPMRTLNVIRSNAVAPTATIVPEGVRRELISLLISSNGPIVLDAILQAHEMIYPANNRMYRAGIPTFLEAMPEVSITKDKAPGRRKYSLIPSFDKAAFKRAKSSETQPTKPKVPLTNGFSSAAKPTPRTVNPSVIPATTTPVLPSKSTAATESRPRVIGQSPKPSPSISEIDGDFENIILRTAKLCLNETSTSEVTPKTSTPSTSTPMKKPSPILNRFPGRLMGSPSSPSTLLPLADQRALSSICGLSAEEVIAFLQMLYSRAMCALDFLVPEYERIYQKTISPEGGIDRLVEDLKDRGIVQMSANSNVSLVRGAKLREFTRSGTSWVRVDPEKFAADHSEDKILPERSIISGEVIALNDNGYVFAPDWEPTADPEPKVGVASGDKLTLNRDGKWYAATVLNKISEAGHWMVEVPALGRRLPCREKFLFCGQPQPMVRVRPLGRTPAPKERIDLKIVENLGDEVLACLDDEDCCSTLTAKHNAKFALTIIRWNRERLVTVESARKCGFRIPNFAVITWEDLPFGEILEVAPWATTKEEGFIKLVDLVKALESTRVKESVIVDLLLL